MAILATIAKPEYDNIIHPQPAGSAYPWSASTGVLDANFAGTIGTTDSIQILTQGYTFAWKPDTVNVLDDAGNLTLLDNVNANATAQVWNNKITYVGTTAATSDEFVVDGNQLKHSVHMVAPPTLPSGFTGTPQFLAIGGDIGTTAEDWASIDLWADGTTHLTDFVTSDDLKFCLKSDGTEIYRIPHITVTDDAGNEVNGQYKLVFSGQTVTMYMLCPWDWMQQAQYPIIIDPTVIVNSAYSTAGNGGRKIVRLSNDWIIIGVGMVGSNQQVYLYVSKDNGQTWSNIAIAGAYSITDFSLASNGTTVYLLAVRQSIASNFFYAFDATTVAVGSTLSTTSNIDSQTSYGTGCSIAVDGQGNLHTAWCSKNSTYPNSNNIRYSKGTVSGTTVTWATPTQITTTNTNGDDNTNPCLVVKSNNNPVIFYQYSGGVYHDIYVTIWNGTSWTSQNAVYTDSNNHTQSNPCSAMDSNSVIHSFWGGENSTSTTWNSLYHGKSSDGGNTWTVEVVVQSTGTGQSINFPTPMIDPNNNIYVFYQQLLSNDTEVFYVKYTASSGTWSTPTNISNVGGSYKAQYPQVLWSEFNMNSNDAVRLIYSDTKANAVQYYSIPLDSPPNAPILSPVSNFDATAAQTLTWQFSDPDPGDTQSAYQLQILDTVAGTNTVDTGKVASTTASYSLTAVTLTNGKQYQWRVTTWDSQGQQGPYSAYGTFTTAAAPSVILTTPAASATDTGSTLTAQWSYSDPANNARQSFQVQLLAADDTMVLANSGTVTSSGNQYTIQYTLANNTSYHVRVRATNSKGVTSAWADNAFSVSFTPPTPATLTLTPDSDNAQIVVAITNPTPGTGDPSVVSNSIYRRIAGSSTWSLIASNVAVNGTYNDSTVASGQGYDYKVTSIGNNNTQVDSDFLTGLVVFSGDWVYNPTSGLQFQFLYNRQGYSQKIQEERTEVQTFGSKPMIRRGPLNARTGTLNALMVNNNGTPLQQIQAFESDMAPHNAYYLKTAAGEVYKVDLHNVQRAMPVEYLNPQAIGISVDWTEIA